MLMHWFRVLLHYEIRLSLRSGKQIALMLGFALIALSLFALGTEPVWLRSAAPAMIWSVVLLSTLLMVEQIFQYDSDSGRLDQLLAQPIPRWIILIAKICGFWTRSGLPMLCSAPLAILLLQLPAQILPTMMGTLLLGTLAISSFATVGAALTLGARQPIMLVMVLVLPMQIPVLIFATYCLERALLGLTTTGTFLWLGVCVLIALCSIPLGAMAIHREMRALSMDDLS